MDDGESTGSAHSSVRIGEPALQQALADLEDFDQSELRHEEDEQHERALRSEEEEQRSRSASRSASRSNELTRERLRYYEDQTPPYHRRDGSRDEHTGEHGDAGELSRLEEEPDGDDEDDEQRREAYFEEADFSRGSIPDLSAAPSVSYVSRSRGGSREEPMQEVEEEEEEQDDGDEGARTDKDEDARAHADADADTSAEAQELVEDEVEEQDNGDAEEQQQEHSASGGVDATVIYNPDASLLPPILRPAWQRGSPDRQDTYGQYNANSSTPHRAPGPSRSRSPAKNNAFYQDRLGGDIFSPMKLQRIFQPPTPPSVDSTSPENSRATSSEFGPSSRTAPVAADDTEAGPSHVEEPEPSPSESVPGLQGKGDTTSMDEGEVEAQLGSLNKAPLFIATSSTPTSEIPGPSPTRHSVTHDSQPEQSMAQHPETEEATPRPRPIELPSDTSFDTAAASAVLGPPAQEEEQEEEAEGGAEASDSVFQASPYQERSVLQRSQTTERPVTPKPTGAGEQETPQTAEEEQGGEEPPRDESGAEASQAQTPSASRSRSNAGVPFTPLTPRRPMKLFSRGTPMFVFRASPSPSARTSASRSSGESGGGPRLTLARGSDTSGSTSQAGRFEIGTDARTPSEFVRKLQRMRSLGRVRGSAQRQPRHSVRPDQLGARRTSVAIEEPLEEKDEDAQEATVRSGSRSQSTSRQASSATPSPSVVRSRVLRSAGRDGAVQRELIEADESAFLSVREQKRLKIGVERSELGSSRSSLQQDAVFLDQSGGAAADAPGSAADDQPRDADTSASGSQSGSERGPVLEGSSSRPRSRDDTGDESDHGQVFLSPHAEQQAHAAWNRLSMGADLYRRDANAEHSALGALPGMRLGVSAGPPRDYVREAPSFMQLIRQQGLGSDAMTITTTRSALGSGSGMGSGSGSAPASVITGGHGPMSRTQSTNSMGASTQLGLSTQLPVSNLGSMAEEPVYASEQDSVERTAPAAQSMPFTFRVSPARSGQQQLAAGEISAQSASDAWQAQRYPSQLGRDISEDEVDAALGGTGRDQDHHLLNAGPQRRVQSSPARAQARSPSKTVTFAGLSPKRVAFSKTLGPSRHSPRKLLRQFSAAAEVEWELAEGEGEEAEYPDAADNVDAHTQAQENNDFQDSQEAGPTSGALENPAQQVQALIQRKTSSGSSDPMRKSTLVHISPEEFNMPMEALENVLGQGRMTFDRSAGKWVKNKTRSRANSETTDKRSVAASAPSAHAANSGSDSQEGLSELDVGSDEARARTSLSRETAADRHSSDAGRSVSHSSNDSTPDPFKNIDSLSISLQPQPRRPAAVQSNERRRISSDQERSRDSPAPSPPDSSRSAWPRESTPPVAGASVVPEPAAAEANASHSEPFGSVKGTPSHGWKGLNNPTVAASAFTNRPKYSSLLRQEVKLMQSASTASSAGSDVAGPISPARLMDVAAALAQDEDKVKSAAASPVVPSSLRHLVPIHQASPQIPSQPSTQPTSPLKPILVSRSPTKSALMTTPRQSPTKGANDETRRSISFVDAPRASQHANRDGPDSGSIASTVDLIPHRPGSPTPTATPRRTNTSDVNIGQMSSRTLEIAQAIQHLAELTLSADIPADVSEVGDTSAIALRKGSIADLTASRRFHHGRNEGGAGHLTLATNASFSVARDRIVELIADVAPWEEHWEEMEEIDLAGRRVETVLRLSDFCPALENVILSRNELSYLTGLPSGVRILKVAGNRLSNMTLFDHLKHLETLDISGNQLTSLRNLATLSRLKDLKANDNAISDLRGLVSLTSLRRLSLRGNKLTRFDASALDASQLERLDLSRNSIQMVASLYRLRNLRELNLDHNTLSSIDLGPKMSRLRVLRLSFNPELAYLDVLPAHKLNTLYVDGCSLVKVEHLGALTGLENFSIRQQASGAVQWRADETRDAKRLFFSGNAFLGGLLGHRAPDSDGDDVSDAGRSSDSQSTARQTNARKRSHPDHSAKLRDGFPTSPPIVLFTLVYLELSGCQLTVLPPALPAQLPNLRHLNLDHNLFTALPSLRALTRLKRLSLVGCRVRSSQSILKAVQGLPELLVLDTRMNPCTLGLYPPVIVVSPLSVGGAGGSYAGTHSAGGASRAAALAEAALPPIPNPEVAQPDLLPHNLKKAAEERRAERRRAEKSFFHKRSAAPDPLRCDGDEEEEDSSSEGGGGGGTGAYDGEHDVRSSQSSLRTASVADDDGVEDAEARAASRKRKLERAAAAAAAAGLSAPASGKSAAAGSAHDRGAASSSAAAAAAAAAPNSATTSSALFLASDVRFLKTLPLKFLQRRQAHRGLLALGSNALTWLDGLVVEWAEVEVAQEFVNAVRADREGHVGNGGGASASTSRGAPYAGPATAAGGFDDDDEDGVSRRPSSVFDPDLAGRESTGRGTETEFWMPSEPRIDVAFNSLP